MSCHEAWAETVVNSEIGSGVICADESSARAGDPVAIAIMMIIIWLK